MIICSRLLAGILLVGSSLWANAIITTTFDCDTANNGYIHGTSSNAGGCTVGSLPAVGLDAYAATDHSVSVTFPQSSGDSLTIAMSGSAMAAVYPAATLSTSVFVLAGEMGNAQIQFWTDGPARPGILVSTWQGSFTASFESAQSNIHLTAGNHTFFCGSDIVVTCDNDSAARPFSPDYRDRFLVPLGVPYTITATDQLYSFASSGVSGTPHSTSFNSLLSLRLYEADGVTPVMMHDAAPEPVTVFLCGIGFLCILACGRAASYVPADADTTTHK